MTSNRRPFDLATARERHADAQLRPHPLEGSRALPIRVPLLKRGVLVARFFLPLELAKPRNRTRGNRQAWQWAEERSKVLAALSAQWRLQGSPKPAAGSRPIVCCIRYSSHEPDATSGWGKVPVDCLQPGGTRTSTKTVTSPRGEKHVIKRTVQYHGLGLLESDSPAHSEVHEWWEPAKQGEGFCVIEVWSGGAR